VVSAVFEGSLVGRQAILTNMLDGDRIEFAIAPGSAAVDVCLATYSGERQEGPRPLV
jgi:hypothetical protein